MESHSVYGPNDEYTTHNLHQAASLYIENKTKAHTGDVKSKITRDIKEQLK